MRLILFRILRGGREVERWLGLAQDLAWRCKLLLRVEVGWRA